jgi:hypothetical protein
MSALDSLHPDQFNGVTPRSSADIGALWDVAASQGVSHATNIRSSVNRDVSPPRKASMVQDGSSYRVKMS